LIKTRENRLQKKLSTINSQLNEIENKRLGEIKWLEQEKTNLEKETGSIKEQIEEIKEEKLVTNIEY
jgi:predicted  nucleic acid-binding Zn-ribbon protein